MRIRSASFLLVLFMWVESSLLACSFDTDCNPGSICLKSGVQMYGMCVGGLSPGNSNDRAPVRDTLDLNGTAGNTCSFDTDCGPGSKCMKSGAIYGTCMR